jgi:hypothetical protein
VARVDRGLRVVARSGTRLQREHARERASAFIHAHFRSGDPVPFVPRVLVRGDAKLTSKLAMIDGEKMWWWIGSGVEGAAAGFLNDASPARNMFFLDARAGLGYREVEINVVGTNLLDVRTFDAQYVYAASFDRASAAGATSPGIGGLLPGNNVLVTAPRAVLLTLEIHYPGRMQRDRREERPID